MAKFDQIFKNTDIQKPEEHPKRERKWIHYTKLIDNPVQYCDEADKEEIMALAMLIDADKGVLQDLLVRKHDTDQYEIIAGHKRRRAVRYLVEENGKKQYEFLPCMIEKLSDVQAEFQVYSSNSHHEKTDYEKMHELERMKYLLENYPEEFPHIQTGRMVERLARQMHMKRTTVGEYLTIIKNLGEQGKEALKVGDLKKSAAVELSGLSEEEQEELLDQGITSHKEIKDYKAKKEQEKNKDKAYQPVEQKLPEQQPVPEQPISKPHEQEPQIPGQYKVVNTEMDVEEDVFVRTTETEGRDNGELPQLKNDTQRKEWLRNYKSWGVWYRDDNIGAIYYKYDFANGTRLIAETYEYGVNEYGIDRSCCYLHLVGGPKERPLNQYGLPKYPYHDKYCHEPDSETELIQLLKDIQQN